MADKGQLVYIASRNVNSAVKRLCGVNLRMKLHKKCVIITQFTAEKVNINVIHNVFIRFRVVTEGGCIKNQLFTRALGMNFIKLTAD